MDNVESLEEYFHKVTANFAYKMNIVDFLTENLTKDQQKKLEEEKVRKKDENSYKAYEDFCIANNKFIDFIKSHPQQLQQHDDIKKYISLSTEYGEAIKKLADITGQIK